MSTVHCSFAKRKHNLGICFACYTLHRQCTLQTLSFPLQNIQELACAALRFVFDFLFSFFYFEMSASGILALGFLNVY